MGWNGRGVRCTRTARSLPMVQWLVLGTLGALISTRRCTRSAISHRLDTIGVCVFMGCVQPCTCHPTGVSKPLLSLRISHDRSAQHTRFRCFHAPQTGRRTTGRAGFRKRRAVLLQMNARNVNCVQWRSLNGVEGGTQLPLTIWYNEFSLISRYILWKYMSCYVNQNFGSECRYRR